MHTRPAIHAILVLAAVLSVSATPEQPKKAADPRDEQIANLKQLYSDALARNEALRQEVQKLTQNVNALQARLVVEQQRAPGTERIPDNWKPFEFDGMRVYLVPLESDQKPVHVLH